MSPGVGLGLARDDPHQGRLPGAVAPDQAHPLAGVDLEVHLIQNGGTAEAEADVEKTEQCHKGPKWTSGKRSATLRRAEFANRWCGVEWGGVGVGRIVPMRRNSTIDPDPTSDPAPNQRAPTVAPVLHHRPAPDQRSAIPTISPAPEDNRLSTLAGECPDRPCERCIRATLLDLQPSSRCDLAPPFRPALSSGPRSFRKGPGHRRGNRRRAGQRRRTQRQGKPQPMLRTEKGWHSKWDHSGPR